MTSNDLVMLSSSPPRPFATHAYSSSPLPSPSGLFDKKSKSFRGDNGGQAQLSTSSAIPTFSSASSLLKDSLAASIVESTRFGICDTETGNHGGFAEVQAASAKKSNVKLIDGGGQRATTTKKRKTNSNGDESSTTKSMKRARKPKDDTLATDSAVELTTQGAKSIKVVGKKKPARKPRLKKGDDVTQSKLAIESISKPSVRRKRKGDMNLADESIAGLGLTGAVKRKTSWTPPAKSTIQFPLFDSPGFGTIELNSDSLSNEEPRMSAFGDLLSNFGFSSKPATAAAALLPHPGAKVKHLSVTKKRLVELVTTRNEAEPVSPIKKRQKKKPRTITEIATAAYAENTETGEPAPLLKFLQHERVMSTTKTKGKASKSRSKSPVKGSRQAPILLSPESAMKQVSKQDFVFGTSSQLAREESPTLLRDLHEAMQASLNQADPLDIADEMSHPEIKTNLWKAASRDPNGDLIAAELPTNVQISSTGLTTTIRLAESPLRGGDIASPAIEKVSEALPSLKHVLSPPMSFAADTGEETSVSKENTSSKKAKGNPTGATGKVLAMPDFATYTTAQLMKEISSYHFKPVKSRAGMITLLEKCWEGKHKAALRSLDTNTKTPAPVQDLPGTGVSPKRPRGRPKKDHSSPGPSVKKPSTKVVKQRITSPKAASTTKTKRTTKASKATQSNEEISDSESFLTPSPPRRRGSQAGKPPLPLQLSVGEQDSSPSRTSSQERDLLFEHITKSITTTSPSKDPQNPSWHEKMLLYDPIILEDLAVWLNTGALGRVGWDGEVAPSEVKKWCEANSICCLWKENLRGGTRSRY